MEGLGIDWQLLVAQLLNFGIIFFLLVWLLKKPLQKVLRERRDQIDQGLKDAAHLKEQRAKLDEEKAKILAEAKEAAEKIVVESQKVAAGIQSKATKNTEQQAEKMINDVKAELAKQKEQLTDDLKDELTDLIKESVAHSMKELSNDQQSKLVDSAVDKLKKLRQARD